MEILNLIFELIFFYYGTDFLLLLDSPMVYILNPLSANITKWSDILKQFVGKLLTNCLSVFDNFVWLALKGLSRYLFICFCWNTVQDFTIVLIGNNLEIVTSSSKRAFDMLIMNLGFKQIQILFVTCWRLAVVRISGNSPYWENDIRHFCWSLISK